MSGISNSVLSEIKAGTKAALVNERWTRGRVESLESRVGDLEETVRRHKAMLARGFWGRLRWLVTGS